MAARPPPSDEDEEPEVVAFGIATVEEHLDDADLDFPASADEVVAALGDPEVPYNASGRTVRLSDAVERTGEDRFESRRELLNALHPVFEELRTSAGPGVVSWFRSLWPF